MRFDLMIFLGVMSTFVKCSG